MANPSITFSQIACIDKKYGIGIENRIPWDYKEDMQFFKKTTTGHVIIMGRKTLDSFNGRLLPNRHHVVLTSTPSEDSTDQKTEVNSVEAAIVVATRKAQEMGTDEVFIIGGESIYRAFADYTDRLYLTVIDKEFKCDRRFPRENFFDSNWHETLTPGETKELTFSKLDRIKP